MAVLKACEQTVQRRGDAGDSGLRAFDFQLFVYVELVIWLPAQEPERLQLVKPNNPLPKKVNIFVLVIERE